MRLLNDSSKKILQDISLFVFDLDGTIYISDEIIDGAEELIEWLINNGKNYVFLTNNSSKSKVSYLEKLTRMGLRSGKDNIFTSNEATALYLKKNFPEGEILYMGTKDAFEEIQDFDINAFLPMDANMERKPVAAVLAYDTEMTYEKLKNFCLFLKTGISYISTHPDINCPSKDGLIPDNGSFTELIKKSTGRIPEKIIGKPNKEIAEILASKFRVNNNEMLIIGDRLSTDIKMGYDNGFKTLLVFSGETRAEDLEGSEVIPDFCLDSVKDLFLLLKRQDINYV